MDSREDDHNRQVNDSSSSLNLPVNNSETKVSAELLSFVGFVFCEKDLEQEHLVHCSLLDTERQLPEVVSLHCSDYGISGSAVKEFFYAIEPIVHNNCMENYYQRLYEDKSYQHMVGWDCASYNIYDTRQAIRITELEIQLSNLEKRDSALFQSSSPQASCYFQSANAKHRHRDRFLGKLKSFPEESFNLLVVQEQELERFLPLENSNLTLQLLKKEIKRLHDKITLELRLQRGQIAVLKDVNEICTRQLIALGHLYYDESCHSKELADLIVQTRRQQEEEITILTSNCRPNSESKPLKVSSSPVKWGLVVASILLLVNIFRSFVLFFLNFRRTNKRKQQSYPG